MDEEKRLRGASSWQYQPKKTSSRLGQEIASYLNHRDRVFEKNAAIVDVWHDVVPTFMQAYCRLDKRTGNTLYIQVVPGPYMHQMQAQAGEILEKLKQAAPRCGIQKIRLIPMQQNHEEL